MNALLKISAVAALVALATPAVAGVHVDVGLPLPFVTVTDPCAAPGYLDASCAYPVYDEPVWIGGVQYRGPLRYRDFGDHREFYVHGAWRAEDRPGFRRR